MMPAQIREVAAKYIENNSPARYPGVHPGLFIAVVLFSELVAQFASFNDMVATEIRKSNGYLSEIATALRRTP